MLHVADVSRVEWRRGDTRLLGPRPAPLTNGTLLIKEVGAGDGGLYTCHVSNSQGDTATGHVLLAAIEPPKISPFTFDGDLAEGDR